MKNIAVYGSLRKGFGNNRLLINSELLSTEVVNIPFRMISLIGFPGLIPSKESHDITIEIYKVDENTYKRVEYLEGYPSFYQKAVIETSLDEVEVYVLSESYSTYGSVESGDWKEHIDEKYPERILKA